MKNKSLAILVLLLLSIMVVNGQDGKKAAKPIGAWKFEAPYAPEGYTSGLVVVGLSEKKHTATMSFTGSDYTIPGGQVKATNDSITFSVYVEGQDVKVFLKIDNDTIMSGKAVYSEGEIPLTLTKSMDLK
jgi:hypothetical protein